jgi:hypothetical protein
MRRGQDQLVDREHTDTSGVGDLELAYDSFVLRIHPMMGHDPDSTEVVFGPLGERGGHRLGHGRRLHDEPGARPQETGHLGQESLDAVDREVPEAVAHAVGGPDPGPQGNAPHVRPDHDDGSRPDRGPQASRAVVGDVGGDHSHPPIGQREGQPATPGR